MHGRHRYVVSFLSFFSVILFLLWVDDSPTISEDAPASDAIHSFNAEITAGKIYVTAKQSDTLKDNKSRPPTLHVQNYSTEGTGVVIVGGGAGAFNAIESLREVCFKASLCAPDDSHFPQ